MHLHLFPIPPPHRSPDSRDGYVYPPPAQVFCDLAIMQIEVLHYLSWEHNKFNSLHRISTSSLEWFTSNFSKYILAGTWLVDRVSSCYTWGLSQHCYSFERAAPGSGCCLPQDRHPSLSSQRVGSKVSTVLNLLLPPQTFPLED